MVIISTDNEGRFLDNYLKQQSHTIIFRVKEVLISDAERLTLELSTALDIGQVSAKEAAIISKALAEPDHAAKLKRIFRECQSDG